MLLIYYLTILATCSAQCFYPDGTNVTSVAGSCDDFGDDGPCCPEGYYCSNGGGVCVSQDTKTVLRGSCSSPNFTEAGCADYCLDVQNGNERMNYCGGNSSYSFFCCWGSSSSKECDCMDNSQVFGVPVVDLYGLVIPYNGAFSISEVGCSTLVNGVTVCTGVPFADMSTAFLSSSTMPTASDGVPTGFPTRSSTSQTPTSPLSKQPTNTAQTASDNNGGGGLSKIAKIGIGVGAAVVIIAIITLITCLAISRRRAQKKLLALSRTMELTQQSNTNDKAELSDNSISHNQNYQNASSPDTYIPGTPEIDGKATYNYAHPKMESLPQYQTYQTGSVQNQYATSTPEIDGKGAHHYPHPKETYEMSGNRQSIYELPTRYR